MKKLEIKKGTVLQHAGELNHKVYYVETGLLRSYAIDSKGKESVFMFSPEGWTMADTNAPETPAKLYIDALEDSTVTISEKDIREEGKNVEKLVKRMSVMQDRIIMLLSTNAIDRYKHFVDTYPDIVQRVPQKMIASFLGVNPETLSAAKREWMKRSG